MKRLIAVLWLSCFMILSGGCDDGKTTTGNGGGGDPGGGGGDLAKGETCAIASDQCAAGLLCHDQGTGPVCHDECDPAVWPSTVCNASDEACGASGTSGACVPSLSSGASCDPADDLCGVSAHCADVTGGSSPVCAPSCSDNNGCLATEACFVIGFLPGGSGTGRVCATSLAESDTCDAAEAYCDALFDCRDLDTNGPICWRFCDPNSTVNVCGTAACVPDDYFVGTLDATTGVCATRINAGEACDPYWDICAGFVNQPWVCADTTGGAFECTRGCDLLAVTSGCPAGSTTCAPVGRVNAGLDPTVGVCIDQLGIQEACTPEANTCPENFGCAGDLGIGFLCRQHIAEGSLGACIGGGLSPGDTQYGLPCVRENGDQDPCNRGVGVGDFDDCLVDCPSYDRATNDWVLQIAISEEGDSDSSFCVRKDDCTMLFEDSADCPGTDACVVFPSSATGTMLNLRTCIPVGAQDVGEACDELADRCLDGLACVGDLDGSGTCRALCDTVDGTWPADCVLQEADSNNALCTTGEGCCIDMVCFSDGVPPGEVGVRLPDFGNGCNMAEQTGCPTGETCLPQAGAWDREVCEASLGTAGVAEQCDPDGTGARGCAANLLCLPFMDGSDGICVEVCAPNDASSCTMGNWVQQPNCIDIDDFGNTGGPPADKIGLCLPMCQDASGCDVDQTCLLAFGTLGICLNDCDATTDQGGGSAECDLGSVCIPDLENRLSNISLLFLGTGTCDETAYSGGITTCTATTKNSDCGTTDSQCIVGTNVPDFDQDLNADDGFCATYVGEFETSCNPGSGARCPTGEACYRHSNGSQTFCAKPFKPSWASECETGGTTPCGASTCVVSAGGVHAGAENGYCFTPCDFNAASFPDEGTSPTDNCSPWEACYQVPAGSEAGASNDGYCAIGWGHPGAPDEHCDDDHGLVDGQGRDPGPNFMCAARGIDLGVCAGFRTAGGAAGSHSPGVEPEGMCIARCLAGAAGDSGTCGGNPGACMADSDTAGQCLSFNLLGAPCDITTQTGCAPFATCATGFFPLPPGGMLTECDADIGIVGQGQPCVGDGATTLDEKCALGLFCVRDVTEAEYCVMACDPAAPACDAGKSCVDVSQAFFGSLGHTGLCLVDDGCLLIGVSGCATAETCAPVGIIGPRSSADHAMQCIGATGSSVLGDPCGDRDNNGECEQATYCAAQLHHPVDDSPLAYCTNFCNPATAVDNTDCDISVFSGRLCRDVSSQFNEATGTYGLCTLN